MGPMCLDEATCLKSYEGYSYHFRYNPQLSYFGLSGSSHHHQCESANVRSPGAVELHFSDSFGSPSHLLPGPSAYTKLKCYTTVPHSST